MARGRAGQKRVTQGSEGAQAEHQAALEERERAYDSLLKELRALRNRLGCLPSSVPGAALCDAAFERPPRWAEAGPGTFSRNSTGIPGQMTGPPSQKVAGGSGGRADPSSQLEAGVIHPRTGPTCEPAVPGDPDGLACAVALHHAGPSQRQGFQAGENPQWPGTLPSALQGQACAPWEPRSRSLASTRQAARSPGGAERLPPAPQQHRVPQGRPPGDRDAGCHQGCATALAFSDAASRFPSGHPGRQVFRGADLLPGPLGYRGIELLRSNHEALTAEEEVSGGTAAGGARAGAVPDDTCQLTAGTTCVRCVCVCEWERGTGMAILVVLLPWKKYHQNSKEEVPKLAEQVSRGGD